MDGFPLRTMYTAALEYGALWYGRLIQFPGTIARARHRHQLLEELQKELVYHLAWLRQHNERVFHLGTVEIVVAEEVLGVSELGESGGEVAFFACDKKVVTQEEMHYFFRLMEYTRRDLLTVVKMIPEEQLNTKPKGKSRTIIDILHHVCNAEEFYISRLGKEADRTYEEYAGMSLQELDELPILERLTTVRNACVRTLEALIPSKKDAVFTRGEYTAYPDEKWTGYKVMRRFLEHEREHYYNILEYIGQPIRTLIC